MSKVLNEVREYHFEDGTLLFIAIDYKNNSLSFVRHQIEKVDSGFTKQQFIFAERPVSYANGWLNILGAMQYALRDARDRLLKYQKDEKAKKNQTITELMMAAGTQELLKEIKGYEYKGKKKGK